MKKTPQRIIYLSFFLLFFIFSSLLIFYGLGYRYNFTTHDIEKNGAFFIKSYPRNAAIFIDGEKTRAHTPNQLINVSPGNHLIEVQKDNYVPWQKTLKVLPGETTFAEEIGLFLADRPVTSFSSGSTSFIINKNQDRYAYLVDNQLWLVNTDNAKNFLIFEFTTLVELIDWSPDDQNLLILQNNQYKIFDINQQTVKTLNLPLLNKIIWDNDDANFIWYLNEQTIYRYNITLETTHEKFTPADDFALSGKFIVVQTEKKISSLIKQYHKETLEEITQLSDLNLGKINLLLADREYLIFSLGAKLYIKKSNTETIEFPASIIKIYGRYLLISDSHEIWLYDYHDDWKNIIDRSSEIVADIIWHPNGSYFINETAGITTLYELDGRDRRNSIQLLTNPLKKMYLFNRDGSQLFVLTPEENFYLQIQ